MTHSVNMVTTLRIDADGPTTSHTTSYKATCTGCGWHTDRHTSRQLIRHLAEQHAITGAP